MVRHVAEDLVKLCRDERGSEGLEKLLIIAAIVLPLLGLLIFFRNEVRDWVVEMWNDVTGPARENEADFMALSS